MSKKEYCLIGLVVVLVGVYAVFFSDWFKPKTMRIEHSLRSVRDAYGPGGRQVNATDGQNLGNVTFALHDDYRLTQVKVVRAEEALTNKYPHPLWHLVSPKGSDPVDGLCYGLPVKGMEPASAYAEVEPLEPGVEYRLLVETSSLNAEHDFTLPRTRAMR